MGPTMWVERCAKCGYEGGGTVSYAQPFEIDDVPILIAYVVNPGQRRSELFQLYRQYLRVTPERAKSLLDEPRVEIGRGRRGRLDERIEEFRNAGATIELVEEEG
jgi:hypothetical protein